MPQRVALVDLDARLPNLTSQLLLPRHDVLAVGTAALAAGHDVDVFVEAWNGVPFAALSSYDVVGAAVTGSNLSRVAELFRDLRARRPAVHLIAGGPHATLAPAEVAALADVVVRDEGEVTFVEVLDALARGDDVAGIEGVSYRRAGRVHHNGRRPFVGTTEAENLDLLTGFRPRSRLRQLFGQGGVYTGYASASRGCPFPCTFCYENMIGGTGFRRQEIEAFVTDVRRKRDLLGTRSFWLTDSNFTTNPQHCRDVLRALIAADLGCTFSALCRTDVGRQPEILDLMKRAGFKTLVLGIEAVDDATLMRIRKKQTVDSTTEAIRRMQQAGLGVYGLFMLGFDEDTVDSPASFVRYADAHDLVGLSIYCLTEYPSLPGRTLPRWRICETDLDYYNGHYVTTFPLRARPSALERAAFTALLGFHHPRRLLGNLARGNWRQAMLHFAHYLQLRKMWRVSLQHQRRLAEIEAPYYRGDELQVDLLRARPVVTDPLPPDLLAGWRDPDDLVAPAALARALS